MNIVTDEMTFLSFLQLLMSVVSLGMVGLFARSFCLGRGRWDYVYCALCEALMYITECFVPVGVLPVFGPADEPVTRYLTWMLCVPVLVKIMLRIAHPNKTMEHAHRLYVADIVMNATIIINATTVQDRKAQLGVFFVGCMLCVYIFKVLWDANLEHQAKHALDDCFASQRQAVLVMMLVSWNLYPIMYLLGPSMYHVVTNEFVTITHAIGDIVAKNVFLYLAWQIEEGMHDGGQLLQPNEGVKSPIKKGMPVAYKIDRKTGLLVQIQPPTGQLLTGWSGRDGKKGKNTQKGSSRSRVAGKGVAMVVYPLEEARSQTAATGQHLDEVEGAHAVLANSAKHNTHNVDIPKPSPRWAEHTPTER